MKEQKVKQLKKIPKEFWKNRDWYYKKFDWYLHLLFPQALAAAYFVNKFFPYSYKWGACFAGKDGEWFWDENELKRVRKIVLQKSGKSKKFVDQIAKNFLKEWRNFEKIIQECEKVDIKKFSSKELYEWYEKLFWSEVRVAGLGYIVECFHTSGSENWYINLISMELQDKLKPLNFLMVQEILTAPICKTFINEEKISLLMLGILIDKEIKLKRLAKKDRLADLLQEIQKYSAIKSALEKHRNNYYWIENSYAKAYNFSIKYFAQKVIDLYKSNIDFKKELIKEEKRVAKNKKAKDSALQKYKISRSLSNIIYNVDVFTYIQDKRKQGVLRINHFFFRFTKELARRTNISRQEALHTIEPELKEILLKGKVNKKELRSRIKRCFLVITPKGYKMLSGQTAKKIDLKIFYEDLKHVSEIKGTVASIGRAQGKVRVVKYISDILKFKQDEILVANNTTPEFVPAMKKAKAIVTEQGGVTIHAAIISRELGTPCVIGIKNATRIFKNGEIIEVDAEKGVIKIIEHK